MDIGKQQRVIVIEPIDAEEIVSTDSESVNPMGIDVVDGGVLAADQPKVADGSTPETKK